MRPPNLGHLRTIVQGSSGSGAAKLATPNTILMPPQRPVILEAELCEDARGEPVRVMLAGPGKLDDLPCDQLGHAIARADGELKPGAHGSKRPVHGLNVLGLENESTGSGSWHLGVTDVWSGAVPGQRMCDDLNCEGTEVWDHGQHKGRFLPLES
jgi:hypothetical protein